MAHWIQLHDNINQKSEETIDKNVWALTIADDEYKEIANSVSNNVAVLISHNDNYTNNIEAKTGQLFEKRLNADVVQCNVGKIIKKEVETKQDVKQPFQHFNQTQEPVVLQCLRTILKGNKPSEDQNVKQVIKSAFDSYWTE